MQKKDQTYIKKENRVMVLDLIKRQGPISRAKIARMTKMSPTTVSRIAATLIEYNIIRETDLHSSGVGRKATLLSVNADSILTVGVELDETKARICVINFLDKVITETEFDLLENYSPGNVVKQIKDQLAALIQENNIHWDKIVGIGVGLPGLIDHLTGKIHISAQLGWNHVDFGQLLENALEKKVFLDNELKLKAYAEQHLGNGRHSERMVMIGFGSGVGSSLILRGDIYRGHSNFAGEIGHTTVDPNGALCPCGSFGCLQTYIAEGFLLEEASKRQKINNLQELIELADNNENWAVNIIERAAIYASLAINNSVCMYNPDTVILTGSLIENHPYITEKVFKNCETNIWEPLRHSFSLKRSSLGQKGVMIGAAMFAQTNFIEKLNLEEGILL